MMATLLILGGMLLMLMPLAIDPAHDFFGVSRALSRAFHPEADLPPEISEILHKLD